MHSLQQVEQSFVLPHVVLSSDGSVLLRSLRVSRIVDPETLANVLNAHRTNPSWVNAYYLHPEVLECVGVIRTDGCFAPILDDDAFREQGSVEIFLDGDDLIISVTNPRINGFEMSFCVSTIDLYGDGIQRNVRFRPEVCAGIASYEARIKDAVIFGCLAAITCS